MCSLANRNTGPSRIYSSLVRSLYVPTDNHVPLSPQCYVLLSIKTGSRDLTTSCVFVYCIQCVNFWQVCEVSESMSFMTLDGSHHALALKLVSSPWDNAVIPLTAMQKKNKKMIVVEFEVTGLFGYWLCCLLVGIAIVCWLMNYAVRS